MTILCYRINVYTRFLFARFVNIRFDTCTANLSNRATFQTNIG